MEVITDFLSFIANFLFNSIEILFTPFINGFRFFASLFINIPGFLLNIFESLPEFYRVGLSGAFGFILLIIFLKVIALVFLKK